MRPSSSPLRECHTAYYTPLVVAGTPPRIGSGTYLANLRGWMAEVTEVPRIGNSGS